MRAPFPPGTSRWLQGQGPWAALQRLSNLVSGGCGPPGRLPGRAAQGAGPLPGRGLGLWVK